MTAAITTLVSDRATLTTQKPSSEETYKTRGKAALEHARRLTDMHGPYSIDAAIAWELVEELQTARERQRAIYHRVAAPTAAFARYCAENPHALESRIYDC